MGLQKRNLYSFNEMLRIVGKIVRRPLEYLLGIFFVSFILGFIITPLELRIFNIPEKYTDGIWLSNSILAFIVFLVSKISSKGKLKKIKEEQEEIIRNLMDGHPFEEEFYQYENELKQIKERYRGEEAYNKIREFIVRKRMENTLRKIKPN